MPACADARRVNESSPIDARGLAQYGIGWRTLLVVFLAALLLRGGWGTYRLIQATDPQALEFPDEQQYWLMANSLANGQGLVDEFGFRATRMPLYPGVLSLFTLLPNPVVIAKIAHWIVGAMIAVLAAQLGTVLFERRVGLLAGLLVALDPFLIFFSSLLLTETFFIAALLFLWLVAARWVAGSKSFGWREWARVGVLGALCIYLRESSIFLLAMLLVSLCFYKGFTWRSFGGAALATLICVLALVPWAARNERVAGSFTWLTHRGGVSLYDGVGPQADGSSNLADVQQMDAVRGLNEVEWDQYFRREALAAMRGDPARVVKLAGVKLARTWNPVPNVESYQSRFVRMCAAIWSIPTFALAAAGVMLLPRWGKGAGWRRAVFLLLPAAYVTMLHCLFVGSVRYRLPAMPMLEILAAFAGILLLRRIMGVTSGEHGARQ